jgi:hypothetical protein
MTSLEFILSLACGLNFSLTIFLVWAVGDLERRVVILEIEHLTSPIGLED